MLKKKKRILKPISEEAEKGVWSKQVASKREYKSNNNFEKCITVYLRTLKGGTQSKHNHSNWE